MMSEQRFIWKCDDETCYIYDTVEEKAFFNVEVVGLLNEQQATINRLQRKCFELEKDYVIETSDISDKIYLDDEITELKKKYGVKNE